VGADLGEPPLPARSPWERRARILVVTRVSAWPPRSGVAWRINQIVDALTEHGSVDVIGPAHATHTPDARVRVYSVSAGRLPRRTKAVFDWLIRRRPFAAAGRATKELTAALAAQPLDQYDLLWCHRIENACLLPRISRPVVVDVDDVDFRRRRQELAMSARWPRSVARQLFIAADARRWERLFQSVSADDAVLVFSNPEDLPIGPARRSFLVRNGLPPVDDLDWQFRPAPRTILFQGTLTYGPNRDAVRRLVLHILPKIRERHPATTLRLVGVYDKDIARLCSRSDVVLTGQVSDMRAELRRADCVIAPIRFGGGTRVKLIEAMLNHIPIIASRAACAGLSVDHGVHVLFAETNGEFAASWDRLATTWSTDVRPMTEAAAQMAKENYTNAAMRADIAAVVRSIE
jgi:glycosyltransferase involved in cell wall biosynthesis